jgi:hypothetical protein
VKRLRGLKREDGRLNIVGERLALARRAKTPPWTQEQLSLALEEQEELSISLGTIGKIEAGIRGVYDFEVAAFARVLEIDTNWLLGLNN